MVQIEDMPINNDQQHLPLANQIHADNEWHHYVGMSEVYIVGEGKTITHERREKGITKD